MLKPDDIIPFVRSQQYRFVRHVGRGGLGATVLLWDDILELNLVCKKYFPANPDDHETYFENFIREMKLMYSVYHKNAVRIFNCFIYPQQKSGFILMEYVNGGRIDEYINANPNSIDDVFAQVIEGFQYLETIGILHRDIRPANILVSVDGTVKIIDFGFGKHIEFPSEFDKSISLNWPFTTPSEFLERKYDFCTEVYFVGKLFEELISDNQIKNFQNIAVLNKMTEHSYSNRFQSFAEVSRAIAEGGFAEIDFSDEDSSAYQELAIFLSRYISKIRMDAQYIRDPDVVITKLAEIYKASALETEVQNRDAVVWCFLQGSFFVGRGSCQVSDIRNFLRFFRAQTTEKKKVVLSNLWTRLDVIQRFSVPNEDDIPF